MTPRTKKILLTSGLVIVGLSLLAYRKVTNWKYAFSNMNIEPFGWPKNVEVVRPLDQDGHIKFNIDVALQNRSNEDFDVSGGVVATLTKLAFIYNGVTVGVANVNITEIDVPALNERILKDIPVTVLTKPILANLANFNDLVEQFNIVGYVEIVGQQYLIGA